VNSIRPDPGRLWAGGLATAVVAALVAVVGIVVARGLLEVPLLAPKGDGVWGSASTAGYALAAGGIALAATALVQLLAATTPRYRVFFSWIMALLTAIATLSPLSLELGLDRASEITTAIVNMVIGIAITTILNGVARSATPRSSRRDNT
jgi:hypothetical protein